MQVTEAVREAAERAVRILGGPVSTARILNVPGGRYQTVQSWIKSGVPAKYCPAFERETRARGGVVRCEELQPDIAWQVLRESAPIEVPDR